MTHPTSEPRLDEKALKRAMRAISRETERLIRQPEVAAAIREAVDPKPQRKTMVDKLYDRAHLCAEDVTPQEQERLVRLMEECGELVQACAKTLRWGWASVNPTLPPEEQETNRDYVRCELADVVALAQKLGVADSPRWEGRAWSLARTAILDGQHIDYEGREQHSARVDALASKLVDDLATALPPSHAGEAK